jgi:hypothetical protein
VRIATPNADDGGVLFRVGGEIIDSVTSAGLRLFALPKRPDNQEWWVLVTGDVQSVPTVRIWVPDKLNIAAYSATVLEAAARGTYVQRDVTAYTITVTYP